METLRSFSDNCKLTTDNFSATAAANTPHHLAAADHNCTFIIILYLLTLFEDLPGILLPGYNAIFF
jgi:hypothetical protein